MSIKRRLEALESVLSDKKCYSFVPIIDYLDGRIELSEIKMIEVPCPDRGVDLLENLTETEYEHKE